MKTVVKKYWFKRKLYGWGWTPVTWQGWLVLGLYVAMMFYQAYRLDVINYSERELLINFLPSVLILTFILVMFCYLTGEKPRWQWGKDKGDK